MGHPMAPGQVFKAKSEPKEVSATQAMPVWLTFDGRRSLTAKKRDEQIGASLKRIV